MTLDTCLAHMRRASITSSVELAQVCSIDPANIAKDVGQQRAVGVAAGQVGDRLDTGEFVPTHGERGEFRLAQAEPERHGLEPALSCQRFAKALQILLAKLHDRR